MKIVNRFYVSDYKNSLKIPYFCRKELPKLFFYRRKIKIDFKKDL